MPPKTQSAHAIPKTLSKAETDSYFASCIALTRPFRMRIVVAAIFVVTFLAIYVKGSVQGSTWIYATVNATMIVVGIALIALSTAMIVHDENSREGRMISPEPLNKPQNPIHVQRHRVGNQGEGVRP